MKNIHVAIWTDKTASGLRRYGIQRHVQQYFCYIVAVSFICEGNQGPWENHRSVTDKLDHIMLYRVQDGAGFEFPTLVMIGTDCISSCKSSYYTINTTTARQSSISQT